MRALLPLVLAVVWGAALSGVASATDASITLDQAAPVYGSQVTFTEVYPKVYSGRQPQYPNQPSTQLDCYQSYVRVWSDHGWTTNKTSLGQGWWESVAGPFTLGGVNGWTGGAASCHATLYYFDGGGVLHTLAVTQFEVGP
jgi:hypothetical protein